jgi:Protein of unknown function (DUF5672)
MPSNLKTVCVVIPIYRTELSASEFTALERCVSVLGNHPIILFKPERLDIAPLTERFPQLGCENFRDDFFVGVAGYNRLLLSDEFYARFSQYQFMLVYQLDAFVFSDQLLDWCSRGYDYIGAPWLPKGGTPNLPRRIALGLRRKVYRWFDIHNRHSQLTHDVQLRYSVGNGGFSLRRIERMRKVLAKLHERAEPYRLGVRRSWGEDLFFSIEANRYRRNVRIPVVAEAIKFSWETNLEAAAQLSNDKLPFGCHAWDKLHRNEWQPIFAQLGLSLGELLEPAIN